MLHLGRIIIQSSGCRHRLLPSLIPISNSLQLIDDR
jgi:hypothetical protein